MTRGKLDFQKMRIHVLTLKFDPAREAFDDGELRDFIKDKEIVSCDSSFFSRNGQQYLSLVVAYHVSETEPEVSAETTRKTGKTAAWRSMVSDADMPLFNAMRDWRNERAKKEGIPVYVISNNTELAHIVTEKPKSLNALRAIPGIGKAKTERYGSDILKALWPKRKPVETPADQNEGAPGASPAADDGAAPVSKAENPAESLETGQAELPLKGTEHDPPSE